jgi:hypothetical protein
MYYVVQQVATVQLRKEEVGENKNLEALFSKLNDKYSGKWVAILENGEVIGTSEMGELYTLAAKRSSKIAALFQASKKGEQLFL